ncbi:MAG: hypothetical protein WAT92_13850 [Saprospiraceae bacterium]
MIPKFHFKKLFIGGVLIFIIPSLPQFLLSQTVYVSGYSVYKGSSTYVSNINYNISVNYTPTNLSTSCSGISGTVANGNSSIYYDTTNFVTVKPTTANDYNDYKNGISIHDKTAIQATFGTGTNPFGNYVNYDLDENGSIANADAQAIQDLLDGVKSNFSSGNRGGSPTPSWYFFHDPVYTSEGSTLWRLDAVNNEDSYSGSISFYNLYGTWIEVTNAVYFRYRVMKMGDVVQTSGSGSNSWICGSYLTSNIDTKSRSLNGSENTKFIQKGSKIKTTIEAEGNDNLVAMYLPIKFDQTKLRIHKFSNLESLKYLNQKYNKHIGAQCITYNHDSLYVYKLSGPKKLFEIEFEVLEDINFNEESITWSDEIKPELVNDKIEISNVEVNLSIDKIIPPKIDFYMYNQPDNSGVIISSNTDQSATLNVYDMSGKNLFSRKLNLIEGQNFVDINNLPQIYALKLMDQEGKTYSKLSSNF